MFNLYILSLSWWMQNDEYPERPEFPHVSDSPFSPSSASDSVNSLKRKKTTNSTKMEDQLMKGALQALNNISVQINQGPIARQLHDEFCLRSISEEKSDF